MADSEKFKPRGTEVALPHGALPETIPPYLVDLIEKEGGPTGPIGLQFVVQPELRDAGYVPGERFDNALGEVEHEVAPGLVHKYIGGEDEYGKFPGRALWEVTRKCFAYCDYCTRGYEVGLPNNVELDLPSALAHTPSLSRKQIDESLAYISDHKDLKEIIVSGGDPLTLRPDVLKYIFYNLGELQKSGQLKIIRLGTRAPIHTGQVKDYMLEAVSFVRHLRLMIHVNHPAEMTPKAVESIHKLRLASDGIVMSQSVLLRGVNDNPGILRELFNNWAYEGFVPYYVYQNDPVYWAKHFTVPLEEALAIWGKVRPVLSGVAATARLVIDTPDGYGKIPLPEGDAWKVDLEAGFKDFKGTNFSIK